MSATTIDSTRRSRARVRQQTTLAIDIGGTGLKASVLDAEGKMTTDRVRIKTTYPCPPEKLVEDLAGLVASLPAYDRISAGFPGMVRKGRILSASNFARSHGPGSATSKKLTAAWDGFDLAAALQAKLGKPTRVVNDADLQGAAAVHGDGLEVVITLGTGMGSAVFSDGRLMPHMELAHHPFRKEQTYEEQVGEQARLHVGDEKWNRRVAEAVQTLDALFFYDRLYIGGGNAKRVKVDLGPKIAFVDNTAGILGGIKLWERDLLG